MSTCPIFERQINFKIINCRKTTGKQSIKRQRLWLNNLLIVIQSLHRKVKHPLSFLFSENRENYVISIFNISFLFLKIAIRLASQNLLQDTKFLNRTNFFAFLTSRLWKKIISLQAFYRLMNFGFFSSDVTRISVTVICSIDRLTHNQAYNRFLCFKLNSPGRWLTIVEPNDWNSNNENINNGAVVTRPFRSMHRLVT